MAYLAPPPLLLGLRGLRIRLCYLFRLQGKGEYMLPMKVIQYPSDVSISVIIKYIDIYLEMWYKT